MDEKNRRLPDEVPEPDTVTLYLEGDEELECEVVTTFEAAGRQYIALIPMEADGTYSEDELYFYRYSESDDDGISLDNIEDDDEMEVVSDAFDEWLDAQEFDALMDEES